MRKGAKGLCRKVWTRMICLINIVYALTYTNNIWSRSTHFLEDFGQTKCFFGSRTVFLGQEVHYYIVHILHIVLNKICKFVIMCKNDAFVAKIANMRRTKIFVAIFALAERLPTSATLLN